MGEKKKIRTVQEKVVYFVVRASMTKSLQKLYNFIQACCLESIIRIVVANLSTGTIYVNK